MSDVFHRIQGLVTKLHTDVGEMLTTTERELLREAEQAVFRYDHLVNFLQNDVRAYDNLKDVIEAAKGIVERNQLRKHAAEQLRTARDQCQEVIGGQLVDTKDQDVDGKGEPELELVVLTLFGKIHALDDDLATYGFGESGHLVITRELFEEALSSASLLDISVKAAR